MCNQLKVEFFKFRHFWLFYLAMVFMAGVGFSYGYMKLAGMGCDLYDAFRENACDTSFMVILALVSAWFIGSDFSNRTIHHEITLGYNRWSVLMVRELPVFLSGILLHFIYIISCMIGVGSKTGFSVSMFSMQDFFWCITIMLQLMALQSIILFISFLCANAAAAIAISVCFMVIACNVLRNFLDGTVFTKTVFCFAPNNTKETLLPTSVVAVMTLAIIMVLTYIVFRKKRLNSRKVKGVR